jgi:hypothetical protein
MIHLIFLGSFIETELTSFGEGESEKSMGKMLGYVAMF